jgi:hypothetical protein
LWSERKPGLLHSRVINYAAQETATMRLSDQFVHAMFRKARMARPKGSQGRLPMDKRTRSKRAALLSQAS